MVINPTVSITFEGADRRQNCTRSNRDPLRGGDGRAVRSIVAAAPTVGPRVRHDHRRPARPTFHRIGQSAPDKTGDETIRFIPIGSHRRWLFYIDFAPAEVTLKSTAVDFNVTF